MKHFVVSLLVGFFLFGPHAFGDVSARNGVSITTAGTINGRTPNSAINGQTITSGSSPAWYDSIAPGSTDTDNTLNTFGQLDSVVAGQSGNCTKLRFRCADTTDGTGNLKLGLFDASKNLLAQGSVANPGAGQTNIWIEVTITSTAVTNGNTYWIGSIASNAALKGRTLVAQPSGTSDIDFSTSYASSFTNPFSGAANTYQSSVGMYIE